MKLKHLMIAGAMALPLLASAKPAYPGIIRVPDANGGYTEIRRHGDEFFNYTTDADCQVILKCNAEGRWEPMIRSGVQVTATAANIEMLRTEHETEMARTGGLQRAPQRMAALDSEGRTTFPTMAGDIHSLVVLLEYSDVKFTMDDPKAFYTRALNEEGFNEKGYIGSAADYFRDASYNKFRPIFDVSDVIVLPNRSAYYAGNGKYDRFREALRTAVNELDAAGFDFSIYDYDQDGEIDTIYFIYAGYGQADTSLTTAIWPHQGNMRNEYINLDGLRFGPYACSNELNGGRHYTIKDNALDGSGTFCHEFSHVLGLPDLYDPNYATTSITPGSWSIMDAGPYNGDGYVPPTYSAYERWVCRWLEFTDPVDGEHYDLAPIGDDNAKGIKLPARRKSSGTPYTNEYFVAESRSKNLSKWDASLPGEGMLIWHIDYNAAAWTGNRVNSTAGHPRVSIVASDGSAYPFKIPAGSGSPSYNAPWPGNNSAAALYPGSVPVSLDTWASGTEGNANVFVTNITFDSETGMSGFDFNKITEVPTGKVEMNTPEKQKRGRGVRLYWQKDPNASSYMLTMYYINSSNRVIYEAGLDEANVGDVDYYDITNMTTSEMAQTYYAYVRAVYGIPSSETSNEISFVPNDLEYVGVEALVGDSTQIVGGKGCIIAPAEAEVYNLSGVRVGKQFLTPGVYIVLHNGKALKVVVR